MVAGGAALRGAPVEADPFARGDPPILMLSLSPNRSLTPAGVGWVVGIAGTGLALPLVFLGGSAASWGLLPFLAGALVALSWAIRRNELDGRISEELRLWSDLITVERREPTGRVRRWHANPFWVRLRLLDDARVEKYLTLQGNGREIELGAFLAPWERETLYAELRAALSRLRP